MYLINIGMSVRHMQNITRVGDQQIPKTATHTEAVLATSAMHAAYVSGGTTGVEQNGPWKTFARGTCSAQEWEGFPNVPVPQKQWYLYWMLVDIF